MAYTLPDNFELLDDDSSLPSNFEILPDNFEIIPEEEGFLDKAKQFGKNVGGAAMGAADLVSNAAFALPLYGAGAVKRAFGEDAETVRKEIQEAMSMATPSNLISKMGLGDPRENQSHQYMMKPFELMQQGVEKGVESLGGGEDAKLLADIGLIAAPIPFAKSAGRMVGRGLEMADPALRKLDAETPAMTRERMALPDNFEIIEEAPKMVESTDGPVTVRYPESDANLGQQLDMFETVNPYDVAGRVTDAMEGREHTIGDFPQGDLFSQMEGTDVPSPRFEAPADAYGRYSQQPTGYDAYGNPTGEIRQTSDWAPPPAQEVTQPLAKVVEDIPILRDVVESAPARMAEEPRSRPPEPPVERVTADVPGLSDTVRKFVAETRTPDEVARAAIDFGKDISENAIRNQVRSGFNILGRSTGNPVVKAIYNWFDQAHADLHRFDVAQVRPLEKSFRSLDKGERLEMHRQLMSDLLGEERPRLGRERETLKTQEAYRQFRGMMDEVLEKINEGRTAHGMEPLTPRELYVSSVWKGRHKSLVMDANGKTVFMLRSPSKRGLQKQIEALKATPEGKGLKYMDMKDTATSVGEAKLRDMQYTDMLAALDPNDPRVPALRRAIEGELTQAGMAELGAAKHFEEKSGVRGFLGDQPGRSSLQNANDLMNAQLEYAKQMVKWSEDQKAVTKALEVLSNPEIQKKMPNTVYAARSYIKHAIGYGTEAAISRWEHKIAESVGADMHTVNKVVNNTKAAFYAGLLGFGNIRQILQNLAQPLFVIPHLMDMHAQGLPINPMKVFAESAGDFAQMPTKKQTMMRDAWDWAVERGHLDGNILSEVHNLHEGPVVRGLKNVGNFNQVLAEKLVRYVMYTNYVNAYKEIPGLTREQIFQSAADHMQATAVDFRPFELPQWFQKGGVTTKLAGSLKSYSSNWYNQMAMFANQAKKGNFAPLATFMAIQFALAGSMGMPGVETFTDMLDSMLTPILHKHGKMQETSLKGLMLDNQPSWAAKGIISAMTDTNLGKSLSQGDLMGLQTNQGLGMGLLKFAAPVQSWAVEGILPFLEGDVAKGLYKLGGPHIKGALEETGLVKPTQSKDFYQNRVVGQRGPRDTALRWLGLKSFKEDLTMDKLREVQSNARSIGETVSKLNDALYDAVKAGKTEDVKDISRILSKLGRVPNVQPRLPTTTVTPANAPQMRQTQRIMRESR